jgi:hypothetical protein
MNDKNPELSRTPAVVSTQLLLLDAALKTPTAFSK